MGENIFVPRKNAVRKAAKPEDSQATQDRQEEPKQKQAKSAIGPSTLSLIQREE